MYPPQLDHLVYGVPDLDAAVDLIATQTGIRPVAGGRHVGRGTANYLIGLGGAAYLEIIGPDPQDADRPSVLPFGLEDLARPALITWAMRTSAMDEAIGAARRLDYDPGPAAEMSRRTPDGQLLEWRLTPDTIDAGVGLTPFLIDWGSGPHPTNDLSPQLVLHGLTVLSPQPEVVRRRLAALGVQHVVEYAEVPRLQAVLGSPRGDLTIS